MYKIIIVISQFLTILRKMHGLVALFLIITKSILLPVRYQSVQNNLIMYIWPYKISMRK